MFIHSVTGPLDTKDLGLTLMHEHVVNLDWNMRLAFDDWFDQDKTLDYFADEIEKVRGYGVKTYVDCSPINLGRDIHLLREAAERAHIQILAATGLYWQEDPWISRLVDEEYLTELYLRDLTQGIQGTDSKAALIKVATDFGYGKSPVNQALLRAAAKASIQSGAPITTHSTYRERTALYQQELLLDAGVAPHKIIIGHAFDATDMEYLEALLQNGTYVACDRVGLESVCPVYLLAPCVSRLCAQGYSKQLMLSHDANIISDVMFSLTRNKRDRNANPCVGDYTAVFEQLIPLLRQQGVTQEQLDQMLIENPRRYFEGAPIA